MRFPIKNLPIADEVGDKGLGRYLEAKSAGKLDKIKYGVADAKSYEGEFDYIAFFDCLHDMGDPVGAAKYAYEHLNDNGIRKPYGMYRREQISRSYFSKWH